MPEQNPPQDPFEIFRRLWGPLGVPVPGMAMPTLDPKEVEKRVADLKSVETWLSMNLNMVRFAIQGLEVQRVALAAMKSGTSEAALAGMAAAGADTAANAMMWPWAVMQQAMAAGAPAAAEPAAPEKPKE
jgi:membrane protease subunit (stomatin/prohibitin family)